MSASWKTLLIPPLEKVEHVIKLPHGASYSDPYNWLRDDNKSNLSIRKLLEVQNEYTQNVISRTGIKDIEHVIIQKTEERKASTSFWTIPSWNVGDYAYYFDKETGENLLRQKDGVEELILQTSEFEGDLGHVEVHPDNTFVAFVVDNKGDEKYTLQIKVLKNNTILPFKAPVSSNERIVQCMKWINNGKELAFIYGEDARSCRLYKLEDQTDIEIYVEKDVSFALNLETTTDSLYVYLTSQSSSSNQVFIFEMNGLIPVFERDEYTECTVEHHHGYFYLKYHDKNCLNSKIVKVEKNFVGDKSKWETVIACREDTMIMSMNVLKDFLILVTMKDCDKQIEVYEIIDGKIVVESGHKICFPFNEVIYTFFFDKRLDFNRPSFSVNYMSYITPPCIIEYNLVSKHWDIKSKSNLQNFDPNEYQSERVFAKSHDGKQIPISMVYKKCFKTRPMPLLLFGYGAYWSAQQPWFLASRICLLDAGFIFATAHVRGGTEKGRQWAIDGQKLKKINSFLDYISCAEHLIDIEYACRNKITGWGRSAGGTLIAGVMKMRPDLFRAIVLDVPFADVITSLSDSTIPWSEYERNEWGNPNIKAEYDVMKEYCPMNDMKKAVYPHIFIGAAWNDARVPYWEPVKLLALLRESQMDKEKVSLLLTDFEGGHYSLWANGQIPLRWAFLIWAVDGDNKNLSNL